MEAIIAYGSLINKQQLAKEPRQFGNAIPVLVKGYKRSFNQEPSWRKGHHDCRAVLNVVPSQNDSFNGLLITLQKDIDFRQLDDRERGYNRVPLAHSQVIPFAEADLPEETKTIHIYVGKPDKRNNTILPNDHYLDLCLEGAMEWSDEFYKRFVETTYVGESLLIDFLQNRT